jgi:hypothetical protein
MLEKFNELLLQIPLTLARKHNRVVLLGLDGDHVARLVLQASETFGRAAMLPADQLLVQ